MRLFRLVEEHHAIGTPAHRLGEASAVTIANVTGRSAHEPGRGLRVAVFAQVDTDEGAGLAPHATLGGEHLLGEHPGRLGLAHAARAGEQERGKGPLSAEPGVVAPDGPGNGGDGIPVPDDPFLQPPLECEKPIALDRKSTRLNSSHRCISYAVFCLKKKNVMALSINWSVSELLLLFARSQLVEQLFLYDFLAEDMGLIGDCSMLIRAYVALLQELLR